MFQVSHKLSAWCYKIKPFKISQTNSGVVKGMISLNLGSIWCSGMPEVMMNYIYLLKKKKKKRLFDTEQEFSVILQAPA